MNDIDASAGFASFYEATKSPVFRAVLMARAGNRQDAEDAVAEAYSRAYLRWHRLAKHPNPTAWVIRTAMNHRISLLRRDRSVPSDTSGNEQSPRSESLDPALIEMIQRLPKGQREVLALRILLDFNTQETAETLGVNQGTVKKQLHRALRGLRSNLSTQEAKEVWR